MPNDRIKSARADADRALEQDFSLGIDGDCVAYRRFLDQLLLLLRAYYRKRLSESADVEDLVQEAVLAIHDRRHTFGGMVPITAWIHAIARHKLLDWLRLHAAERREAAELSPGPEPSAQMIEPWQAERDVRLLLATLPDRQRAAIEQVRLLGCSVREVAAALGMSEAAVKVSVHRGIKALSQTCRWSTR
ncbi:MAG: sigma-70 family RNA polymerase sigma factor [Methylibium sp.]|nr:sigma-70 family RNA polymerase sigma factor [Methylibium sp.]MBA3623052.1 sigma-70 family RNA polymerase sigma factor [Methylibium sp.]